MIYQAEDTIVRLEDIAEVELGAEDYDTVVRYSGDTAVFAGIFPQPNANVIDVIGGVREELDRLKREMPPTSGRSSRFPSAPNGVHRSVPAWTNVPERIASRLARRSPE